MQTIKSKFTVALALYVREYHKHQSPFPFRAISDLIFYLRQLGFDGPYSGGNHQFMKKEALKVRIPNPHQSEISKDFLIRILRQAGVEKKIWEDL